MTTTSSSPTGTQELVVLVDEAGQPVGERAKSEVHTTTTPLHLAFSVHLLDAAGRVLLTRRALSKRTWPGVWTNSCCGHPAPGELTEDAIVRRLADELGLAETDLVGGRAGLRCVLPDFAYRATDASGVVENEICPVYAVRLHPETVLAPNPAEVLDWAWVDWPEAVAAMAATPFAFSPWAVGQLAQFHRRGVDPTV